MRWLLALLAVTLASNIALADSYTGGGGGGGGYFAYGNGATTATAPAVRDGERIDVKADFGARGDTLTFNNGVITAGSTAFYSTSALFAPTDVGKVIVIDYAGAGGAPLATTIKQYVDQHNVVLAAAAGNTVPYSLAWFYVVTTPQSGAGSYAPGDTITVSGGSATAPATGTVVATQVVSATIVNGGSGGITNVDAVNGTCAVQGTTGTPGNNSLQFTINTTLTNGVITAVNNIVWGGMYSTNPTDVTKEPVAAANGCTGLTGAVLAVKMGARMVQGLNRGVYSAVPAAPQATTTSGSGTGLTLTIQFIPAGNFYYGTDDTPAFTKAILAVLNKSVFPNATAVCIDVPAGQYILSSPLPTFYKNPGCISGEGQQKSILIINPNMYGNLFSWSENWIVNGNSFNGGVFTFAGNPAGPIFRGISVIGDHMSPNSQNALAFNDHNDEIIVDNVSCHGVPGSCLVTGKLQNATTAYARESEFTNIKAWSSGNATHPVFDISANHPIAGSNELKFDNINIYAYYGHAVQIHNEGLGTGGNIHFNMLRIEGLEFDAAPIAADGFVIGDAAEVAPYNYITCTQCSFIDPYYGQWAIRLDGASPSAAPYNIDVSGSIIGGVPYGGGLNIKQGRNSKFYFGLNGVWGCAVNSAGGGQIQLTSIARAEQSWNYCGTVALSANAVIGAFAAQQYFSLSDADKTAVGGNTPTQGSIDLQVARSQAWNIPRGFYSSILWGGGNQTDGNYCSTGGQFSACSGDYSLAYGLSATDRAWTGGRAYASGTLSDFNGDAQVEETVLRCQTAATNGATCRLTSNNNGTATLSPANSVNIPNNAGYAIEGKCEALDRTTTANAESWNLIAAHLTRSTAASTTTFAGQYLTTAGTFAPLSGGVAATFSNGTVTGSTMSLSADTSLGVLNATFKAPTTNADVWDVSCHIHTQQTQ